MRTRMRRLCLWASSVIALTIPVRDAAGTCGSASCPVDTFSREPAAKRWIRLGYEFEYIDQDQARILGRSAAVGEIVGEHDERYTTNRIHRLAASAGVTERLGVEVQLPFISRSHGHLHRHEDGDLEDATWSFSGTGDLITRLRYAVLLDEGRGLGTWSVIAGGKFPTGRHHVKNSAGDHAEPGITPGTGSYDLILGAAWHKRLQGQALAGGRTPWPLYLSLTYRVNGPGDEGYRLGNVFQANVGTAYPVSRRWGALVGFDLLVRQRDWKGRTNEETQKTGGEFLYFSPGVLWRITDHWEASSLIQIPVHQRVNQIQIVSRYNMLASVSYRFQF